MMTHDDEEDHSVSGTLTEGAEAGTLLLLHGKILFLTDSAKGNPLGGLYIRLGLTSWSVPRGSIHVRSHSSSVFLPT